MTDAHEATSPIPWSARLGLLLLVMGGGILIGTLTAPGAWYAALTKPVFNPPNWIFGPVWTVLYILIAMVGWRLYAWDRGTVRMKLWWAQLGLNFIWSPVFFVLHLPWVAFGIIAMLFVVIVALVAGLWGRDRVSALALVPYLGWVTFAAALNLAIAVLN
ncbi:TspO/MBR family protein [Ruegeria sp. R14_0]|uniref:TspO/MBR family protein n=1 Tax=Ruegeria sp. R14_0 TaxID=2821100 RepID=UPI001ADBBA1B|nr:TspO/MBR family protein [Ruegeria sp. R14_0]MBO9444280.1 tryptophan-rich sensory protein [Ruegeria sp. R14_0]